MRKFNRTRFSYLSAFFLLIICHLSYSQQVGTDSVAVADSNAVAASPKDTVAAPPVVFKLDTITYRFIGDGNFTRGNVNRSLMVLRAEIIATGPVLSIATNPRFTYGRQNGILAERDSYMDLFVDVFKKRKTYVFGLGTLETSNLRGITLRVMGGAGIGYRLLSTEKNKILLTNALVHESTNFRELPTKSIQRNSFRVKGKHSFAKDRFRINHITFVQPAITDISNLRWNTVISLEFPVNKWVALRSSYENSYESLVEAGRKRNDSRVTFGISVGNRQ
ncbi:Protein of unknown function, DUF481 [Dyadobacter koreensis]|uniref:DUF481 domain-containing protein n=1 Tax=Dyadobacter koreensis TaxID=408657 RepID=A0A1H7APB0_9BACT|nr:DUF481 domain-containing protein [Dyadobacter koreensis]SEJ67453.1 Protein of unknown function, DUF481 [Dyadobacter koreensis]